MGHYTFVSDYKDRPNYRYSFNELAKLIYGIDFEPWYQRGYWRDQYICYSYLQGDKMVANVSVTKMDVIVSGKLKRGLQIGTVMTHPDYRRQGLAARLMDIVIAENEGKGDFMYLFANAGVLQFYPRFGFKRIQQSQYSASVGALPPASYPPRQLDLSEPADLSLLHRLSERRVPVASSLGVINDQPLLMFYLRGPYRDNVYYLADADLAVVCEREANVLKILDIIGPTPFELDRIIAALISKGIDTIEFCFTPEGSQLHIHCEEWQSDDALFIRPGSFKLPQRFMFPELSHA